MHAAYPQPFAPFDDKALFDDPARGIAVAEADVACKRSTGLVDVRYAVESAYQRARYAAHERELQATRVALRSRIDVARAPLQRARDAPARGVDNHTGGRTSTSWSREPPVPRVETVNTTTTTPQDPRNTAPGAEPGPALGPGSVVVLPISLAARRTWYAFAAAALHLPIATVTFTVVVTGLALAIGLMPLALLGIPVFGLTVLSCRPLAALERSRAHALLGRAIEAPMWPPQTSTRWYWSGALKNAELGQTWRMLAYLGIALPLGGALLAAVTLLPPAYGIGAVVGAWVNGPGAGDPETWLWMGSGLVALALTPVLAQAAAALWWAKANALLSRSETAELTERVETLTVSREALAKAAEAERARIERDLHDGAQQRLVSLTMNLGIAKSRMQRDPEAAAEHVAAAHEDAKAALGELRDLARGIHPVILSDRGLAAALSAVAARAPVPVQVDVAVEPRPSATVEAVAYFVVMEALTNVARHSGASRAWVRAERRGDLLHLEIEDDGRGGVDPARGSGLSGLTNRVAGVEGQLRISSPDGGPTLLTVELPCAS